jgi:hypothetical protein
MRKAKLSTHDAISHYSPVQLPYHPLIESKILPYFFMDARGRDPLTTALVHPRPAADAGAPGRMAPRVRRNPHVQMPVPLNTNIRNRHHAFRSISVHIGRSYGRIAAISTPVWFDQFGAVVSGISGPTAAYPGAGWTTV